jgi:hypothetical protein
MHNARQGISHLMSQHGSHLSEKRQAVVMASFFFGVLLFCEISEDHNGAADPAILIHRDAVAIPHTSSQERNAGAHRHWPSISASYY